MSRSVEFYTQFRRPEKVYEKNTGERIVESAGYIPANVQITMMQQAGQKLKEWRMEQFDYGPDDVIDLSKVSMLTRNRGVDYAEVSEEKKEVEKRLKRAKEEKEIEDELEKNKTGIKPAEEKEEEEPAE